MASYLTEVTSKKTAKTMGIQTTLDSAGHVRIVKSRQKGQLPQALRSSVPSSGLRAIHGVTLLPSTATTR
jgi:hypothetical protein